ncbi:hypothetical protein JG688_00014743 [Phytophthora aleatoria]|uniref:Uncharacterized protein n=1 Tax=Phytophthora aleatoria TaxID=2496075 RepID=A0A8J5IJC0_9STRA|nr:hypothetical protein JG688_00014743 [Phytophthora aleatoria]
MYHAITEEICDKWRNMLTSRTTTSFSFSDMFDNVLQDIFSEQAVLPDQEARNLSTELKRFYTTFFYDAEANDLRYLKAVAGSKD